jgi:hypothetical protein
MSDQLTNPAIVQRMLRHVRGTPLLSAQSGVTGCGSAFSLDDFTVTYPNNELLANVAVTAIPAGTTLVGVTVAVSPSPSAAATYCMGVASDATGMSLPVSVLGASTSPVFSGATLVTGTVVLCYVQGGATQECVVTKQFAVGG